MTRVSPANRLRLSFISILAAALAQPAPAAGQQPVTPTQPLTLAEAWAKAEAKSDQLAIAAARTDQARGNALEAGSFRKPRLGAYSSYDRTLRSEFDAFTGFTSDSSTNADTESAEVPFGSAHTYRAGLTASYMVFSGGRSLAQSRAAASTRRAAEIGLTTARAQVRLDVTEAYYDAMLADRLHRIAEWTLEQAESTYRRIAMVSGAGRAAEFDVVRAKAARDRQRPVLIRRAAERDIAMLRLRQLLHVPADADLALPADIVATTPSVPGPTQSVDGALRQTTSNRTAVREAAELVMRSEQMLQASQAGRLPAVSLTSTYERVAYPLSGKPSWNSSRANWTVGARVELPVMTGGRQQGSDAMARAEVDAAHARLRLTQQMAELDTRSSLARLAAAEASLDASQANVDEAERAYGIAMLRYREGVSIQLELSDARLLLEQARADQARAARDVSVERVRATLLIDLPLSSDALAAAQATTARVTAR
ncbi:MAG TPA: TolC family protein [Gemmatimonadaceae bacterium]|nr:TolC family protein [Gemmatimonadaceae bacterium]